MTGNCGFPDGVTHQHVERCNQGGRRDALAEVWATLRAEIAATSIYHANLPGLLRAADLVGMPDAKPQNPTGGDPS